jgi:hypothetical protein
MYISSAFIVWALQNCAIACASSGGLSRASIALFTT